jgi:hypothetical protein
VQGSKAGLTPRYGGTYGRNQQVVTLDLEGPFPREGRSLPKLCKSLSRISPDRQRVESVAAEDKMEDFGLEA